MNNNKSFAHNSNNTSKHVSLDPSVIPTLIGPKGITVSDMRRKSGASISFEVKNETATATISGTEAQILAAIKLIDHKVQEFRHFKSQLNNIDGSVDDNEIYEVSITSVIEAILNTKNEQIAELNAKYKYENAHILLHPGSVTVSGSSYDDVESLFEQAYFLINDVHESIAVPDRLIKTPFDNVVRTLSIPKGSQPFLIGPSGDVVKKIRLATRTFVKFTEVKTTVKGRLDDVKEAVRLIQNRLADYKYPSQSSISNSVPHAITSLPAHADKFLTTYGSHILRQVRDTYSVSVCVEAAGGSEKQCIAYASRSVPDGQNICNQAIADIREQLVDFKCAAVLVPTWAVGRIIGKSGDGLKRIAQSTNNNVCPFFPSTDSKDKLTVCLLAGLGEHVDNARRILISRLASVSEQAGTINICVAVENDDYAFQLKELEEDNFFGEVFAIKYSRPFHSNPGSVAVSASHTPIPILEGPLSGTSTPVIATNTSVSASLLSAKLANLNSDMPSPLETPVMSSCPSPRFNSDRSTKGISLASAVGESLRLNSTSKREFAFSGVASTAVKPSISLNSAPNNETSIPSGSQTPITSYSAFGADVKPSVIDVVKASDQLFPLTDATDVLNEDLEGLKFLYTNANKKTSSDRLFIISGVEAERALTDPQVWASLIKKATLSLAHAFYDHDVETDEELLDHLGEVNVSIYPGCTLFTSTANANPVYTPAGLTSALIHRKVSNRLLMGVEFDDADKIFNENDGYTTYAWQSNLAIATPDIDDGPMYTAALVSRFAETTPNATFKSADDINNIVDTDIEYEPVVSIKSCCASIVLQLPNTKYTLVVVVRPNKSPAAEHADLAGFIRAFKSTPNSCTFVAPRVYHDQETSFNFLALPLPSTPAANEEHASLCKEYVSHLSDKIHPDVQFELESIVPHETHHAALVQVRSAIVDDVLVKTTELIDFETTELGQLDYQPRRRTVLTFTTPEKFVTETEDGKKFGESPLTLSVNDDSKLLADSKKLLHLVQTTNKILN